jgi:hypothetical protein
MTATLSDIDLAITSLVETTQPNFIVEVDHLVLSFLIKWARVPVCFSLLFPETDA